MEIEVPTARIALKPNFDINIKNPKAKLENGALVLEKGSFKAIITRSVLNEWELLKLLTNSTKMTAKPLNNQLSRVSTDTGEYLFKMDSRPSERIAWSIPKLGAPFGYYPLEPRSLTEVSGTITTQIQGLFLPIGLDRIREVFGYLIRASKERSSKG